jgi:hypothetical protein
MKSRRFSGGRELRLQCDRLANRWNNRLVSDAAFPPEKRLTTTNVTQFVKDFPSKFLRRG